MMGVRKVVRRIKRLLSPSIPRLMLVPMPLAFNISSVKSWISFVTVVNTDKTKTTSDPARVTHLALPDLALMNARMDVIREVSRMIKSIMNMDQIIRLKRRIRIIPMTIINM
jgi:hypothetical protein